MSLRLEECAFGSTISNTHSFSFEAQQSKTLQQKTPIDHCLKLHTHQSLQNTLLAYPSRQDSPNKQRGSFAIKKGLKTESVEMESDYQVQLMQEEYELRIESLTKQHELKLSKQEEFYQLREWKLKEELENLTMQLTRLEDEIKKVKGSARQEQGHCSTCSNGTVISHLNNVISQLQESHSDWIDKKKELMRKAEQSEAKVASLQEENQNIYEQLKKANRQVRQMRNQSEDSQQLQINATNQLKEKEEIWKFEEEGWRRRQTVWKEKEQTWKVKQQTLERKISELTKSLISEQRGHKKREESCNGSKVSVQSIEYNDISSMRASLVHSKDNKQNIVRNKPSLPKRILQDVTLKDNWEENPFVRRLNDSVTMHPAYQRMERTKWKHF